MVRVGGRCGVAAIVQLEGGEGAEITHRCSIIPVGGGVED